jgi:hypothetical protein
MFRFPVFNPDLNDEAEYGHNWDAAVASLWQQGLTLINSDEPLMVEDGVMHFRTRPHKMSLNLLQEAFASA